MTQSVEYEVVRTIGSVEIRRYPSIVLATVSSSYDDTAFSILFNYISGKNDGGRQIPMTAPVISQEARGEHIEMTTPVISEGASFSFVLPPRFDAASAPRPLDQRIKVTEIPSRLVAVVRFSGRAYDREVIAHEHQLLDALRANNIRPKGSPFLMRYNSPFAPGFMRRNEVGVEVDPADLVEKG